MFHLESVLAFLRYNDWANQQLLHASSHLNDGALDQMFDMGRGSIRRNLLHTWAGEHVWLQRWQGRAETPWPDEDAPAPIQEITDRFGRVRAARDLFVTSIQPETLTRPITYRDSKGELFVATLSDMMMQGIIHSIHHRAQTVNMLRRAGGPVIDLDYMYWTRQPVRI